MAGGLAQREYTIAHRNGPDWPAHRTAPADPWSVGIGPAAVNQTGRLDGSHRKSPKPLLSRAVWT